MQGYYQEILFLEQSNPVREFGVQGRPGGMGAVHDQAAVGRHGRPNHRVPAGTQSVRDVNIGRGLHWGIFSLVEDTPMFTHWGAHCDFFGTKSTPKIGHMS